MTETAIVTMFATFVGFVAGVMGLTEAVNKLFKVEKDMAKLIISWVISIGGACLGFALQFGFFADCGSIDTWQGWVKTLFVGLGCGLCANGLYDRNEMWTFLEFIFSIFKKSK